MDGRMIKKYCVLDKESRQYIEKIYNDKGNICKKPGGGACITDRIEAESRGEYKGDTESAEKLTDTRNRVGIGKAETLQGVAHNKEYGNKAVALSNGENVSFSRSHNFGAHICGKDGYHRLGYGVKGDTHNHGYGNIKPEDFFDRLSDSLIVAGSVVLTHKGLSGNAET